MEKVFKGLLIFLVILLAFCLVMGIKETIEGERNKKECVKRLIESSMLTYRDEGIKEFEKQCIINGVGGYDRETGKFKLLKAEDIRNEKYNLKVK